MKDEVQSAALAVDQPTSIPVVKPRGSVSTRYTKDNPGPGRPKGVPNKATRQFKEALLETFEQLGGVTHLTKWAEKNPTEFYRIMGRTLPIEAKTEIRGADGLLLANIKLEVSQYLEARQRVIDEI